MRALKRHISRDLFKRLSDGILLSVWLDMPRSQVFGYALDPPTQPSSMGVQA